jgi:A/G-specific adenine glycosylase
MEKTAPITRSLLTWFRNDARALPWRRTRDPYAIWISEVMLQQTQVKTVIPYWERWMKALPTIESLARARSQRLHKLWEGLGYYSRVRNLQKAARVIMERHEGRFPERFEEVLALPGVGRYTAGAICSIAFNQAPPVLDGKVTRGLARLFCVRQDPQAHRTRERLWTLAGTLVKQAAGEPPRAGDSRGSAGPGRTGPCSALNQALMELGALVCVPRNPKCGLCPVSTFCQARAKGQADRLPRRARSVQAIKRRQFAFVVERNGRFLVRRRDETGVNARLWEFPSCDVSSAAEPQEIAQAILGTSPRWLKLLATLPHSITRYRIRLEVYRVGEWDPAGTKAASGRWLTPEQMRRLPFTAAHSRIVRRLQARKRNLGR